MKITLRGGDVREFDRPMSIIEIANSISEGLGRMACVGKIDGETCDLRTVVDHDCEVEILTFDSDEGKSAFRHTAAHILAQAVKRLYPDTKLAIGPSIKDGFYYDFDRDHPFTADELVSIEAEMKKIVKENLALERFELPREEALSLMKEKNEPYKVELIEDLPEDASLSFYRQGDYVDLCAGPHLMSTKPVKAFKLTSVAGAYWRGDEHNKMLTRIYGTAFTKASDLQAYLDLLEEAKKRDHRKLGKEMRLFFLPEEGPGFPVFLPNGLTLRNQLIDYWRQIHRRENYTEVSTPIILSRKLWETSGHWDHYKDDMFTTKIEDEDFAIKPMNCPGSILVYKNEPHSYRDLPLRIAELGTVHRNEKSGELHGLFRARCFTQDDAHIFLAPEQIEDEIKRIVSIIDEVYTLFGFKYFVELSTRPDNSMGSDEDWENAENGLKTALEDLGIAFTVNEGDGAFYGPKIDFHLRDSLGREWQCATIQLDFQLPQRFDLEYTAMDGEKHRPVMIHRVVFGSVERFLGVLIEHFGGKFPAWLAPVQAKILPISEKSMDYATKVYNELRSQGFRVELDDRSEKIGYKIREAQLQKVNYMLVLGAKEAEEGTVNVRPRDCEKGEPMDLQSFMNALKEEQDSRKTVVQ